MVGDMAAVTEPILDSVARAATEQLLNDAAEAIEEEELLAHRRERAEAKAYADAVQRLSDGIAKMAARFDSYVQREEERQREARAKARKALEDSLPDPEGGEWPGADPAPNLQPDPREGEDQGAYGAYPDAEGDPDPDLPEGMGTSGIVGGGTMPELPEQLGHPQPSEQTQTAIGGP
jgi:hypothetical protein